MNAKVSKIVTVGGNKTTLQKSIICEALKHGIPVITPDDKRIKCIISIFDIHNRELKQTFIDDEPPEAYYGVDPIDEIFNKPLNQL